MAETATLTAKVTDMASYRSARDVGTPMVPAWHVSPGLGAPPTGTVTFLLTDIEGSTPRWEAAAAAMTAAVRRHYEILDAAVTAHGGFRPIEQGEGDSLVAAFPRASDAAAAALEAQAALTREPWPESAEVRVRMALHTGEAQLRDELYYVGPSIIRCARLRALAHGDQVLLSGSAALLLTDALPPGASVVSLGRHRLKGLRTPEQVFQLAHPDLPQSFPPLPTTDEKRTTVPIPLTSFLGREAELAEVTELTQRHHAVSIVGTGGCGKTRLSAQVAGQVVDVFDDGVWWVELAETASPDAVPTAILAALSLDARGMDPLDRLADYLAERDALIVLDNCEHVVSAAADLVEMLLRSCPGIRVLATSREPLGVPGEVTWRIGPLGLPPDLPDEDLALDEIHRAEAVRLFVDRAATARPGYRLSDADAYTVAAICRRLDGIPLAVELAAARMRVLPPARILDGLRNRIEVSAGAVRGAPSRQQTLARSVEWSFDLLGESERILLRRLAVFNGPFDLAAAEAVTPGDGLGLSEVLPLLAGLVDKSLVGFDGEYYVLLQTIRDFAGDRLDEAGEVAALRDAHLAHFRTVAAAGAAELAANASLPTLTVLENARTNLLAAVDWALERDDAEAAQQIAADLVLFWQLHGLHSESLTTLRQVLSRTPDEPSPARARVLAGVGQLAFYGMDMPNGYGGRGQRRCDRDGDRPGRG